MHETNSRTLRLIYLLYGFLKVFTISSALGQTGYNNKHPYKTDQSDPGREATQSDVGFVSSRRRHEWLSYMGTLHILYVQPGLETPIEN